MKNSFLVRFAINRWLTMLGLAGGPLGAILGFFASWFLGDLFDRGIILLDLTVDSIKEAIKDEKWRDDAKKAYDHAMARVYTDAEKNVIRKQYQDILKQFATFGVSNDQHP
jgi:hypothetical protein